MTKASLQKLMDSRLPISPLLKAVIIQHLKLPKRHRIHRNRRFEKFLFIFECIEAQVFHWGVISSCDCEEAFAYRTWTFGVALFSISLAYVHAFHKQTYIGSLFNTPYSMFVFWELALL